MLGRTDKRLGSTFRTGVLIAAAIVSSSVLAACGGGGSTSGPTTLNMYINPDSSGTIPKVAAQCTAKSGGRYRIAINVLPQTADGQREQIVRRLAAHDSSIDFVFVDPPYMVELANAGWLRSLQPERDQLLPGVLAAPIQSAVWKGQLYGVPYEANTQLLWYRRSVARKAGVDPTKPDFTWDKMIDAALKTGTTVAEQGKKYEGYMVWVNALVTSAGGSILSNNNRGRDATASVSSAAGREAATIIGKMARSKAAGPTLSTQDEEISRALFAGPTGGFLLNWPYIYAAYQADVKGGALKASVLKDIGWARYPRVDANRPSKPPLGGINLAVSKFSKHPDLALDAIKCLITPTAEKALILGSGNPVANGAVYDDPAVQKTFPMALLMRESINAAGPRPVTPYYGDVSGAIQRTWHPPSGVSPSGAPKKAATLIRDVLHDKRLL